MAIEEIPLRRIRTPAGDVPEYTSLREGLNALSIAILDLREAFRALDRKVARDLNTLDEELNETKRQVSELRGELNELVSKLPASIGGELAKVGKLIEEKVVPVLEGLEGIRGELSEVLKHVRLLGLRLDYLEARISALEAEVRRLMLTTSGPVREGE